MALARAEVLAGGGRWGDFWVRLASALVLGPVSLFCLWHGGVAWWLFISVAMAGLGVEWGALTEKSRFIPGLLNVLVLLAAAGMFGHLRLAWELALLLAGTLAVAGMQGRFAAIGIPYAGIGGLALLSLRLQPHRGLDDTLFLVAVIWATDIGAYLVGRILGGAKMAPLISPGKTWSGAAGGLVFAVVAGVCLAGWQFQALPVAVLLSVAAQAGDLLESGIKRRLGVKDSGRTIPGHGGLFDRLDGFLVAAPVAVLLALAAPGGLPLWR